MSSIRSILEEKLKRAYFNGSTDVIARANGVIPNNTKLGEIQIEDLVDQALKDISELIDGAKPPYEDENPVDSITGEPVETYGYEEVGNKVIDEYTSNLKELLK